MSAVRVVPVQLQVGKKYVLNSGEVITIKKETGRGSFEGSNEYFYEPNGVFCGQDAHYSDSVARPYYQFYGQEYVTRNGTVVTLTFDEETEGDYVIDRSDGGCNRINGADNFCDEERGGDLMDYAPARATDKSTPQCKPCTPPAVIKDTNAEPELDPSVLKPLPSVPPVSLIDSYTDDMALLTKLAAPDKFNENDRQAVWDAWVECYTDDNKPSIDLFIDARKKLKAQ